VPVLPIVTIAHHHHAPVVQNAALVADPALVVALDQVVRVQAVARVAGQGVEQVVDHFVMMTGHAMTKAALVEHDLQPARLVVALAA